MSDVQLSPVALAEAYAAVVIRQIPVAERCAGHSTHVIRRVTHLLTFPDGRTRQICNECRCSWISHQERFPHLYVEPLPIKSLPVQP